MSQRGNLSAHILPTSATMVGVCMTVISIAKLIERTHHGLHIDEILAVDSVLFLLSAAFSYLAMRAPDLASHRERVADRFFMAGLTLMVVAGIAFAFELA